MRKIVYTMLITVLLFACKSNHDGTPPNSTNTASVIDNSPKLIAEFKPIIQGSWVKLDYIDKVGKTKSPLAAADLATGATTMYINTNKITGDSLTVGVGWGNHEGGELTLTFKPGKRNSTIRFGAGDLGYSIHNGDTILTTYWPDNSEKMIATHYKRALIKQADDDLGYGLNYLINKGTVAGKYLLTDTSGITSFVTFSNNGKVTGLSHFKTYYVENDLNVEPMNNLDAIGFDIYKKKHESFSFKINLDTLKLYDTRPNADSTLLILDKQKYILIKQK